MTPMQRLIAALDVPGAAQAEALVERLKGSVGMFKVGSQLFTAAGPDFVRGLTDRGASVFLDLKYHDIPNTVASAVAATASLGVSLLDVHALGGVEMMRAAVAARQGAATRLLAITVLTSHDEPSLARLGLPGGITACVRRLALLAQEAGMDGVVASPHEVELIREACGVDFLVVTPGIRLAGSKPGDQARAATPAAALRAGASYLVVGRPITEAANPAEAARAILAQMESAAPQ
jgi:orotidine-5'-phosphate decarboxylase